MQFEDDISMSDTYIDPTLIVDPLDATIDNRHHMQDKLFIDLSLDTQFKTLGE
jgi:hypothetical protein